MRSAVEGASEFLNLQPQPLPDSNAISKLVPRDWAINSDRGADKHTLNTPLRITSTQDTHSPPPSFTQNTHTDTHPCFYTMPEHKLKTPFTPHIVRTFYNELASQNLLVAKSSYIKVR